MEKIGWDTPEWDSSCTGNRVYSFKMRSTFVRHAILAFFVLASLAACNQTISDLRALRTGLPGVFNAPTASTSPTIDTPTPQPTSRYSLPNWTPEPPEQSLTLATSSAPGAPARTPTPIPTPTTLPQKASQLLFLSGHDLLIWDPRQQKIEQLAKDIQEYSLSANQRYLAMVKSESITANGNELFQLQRYDLYTRQWITLLEKHPRIRLITISPDGSQIAYIKEQAPPLIQLTSPGRQPRQIGECSPDPDHPCAELTWSPDSQFLLWRDPRGVWLFDAINTRTHLAFPNTIGITDPKGGITEVSVEYQNLTWAPNSRFFLARVKVTPSGANWFSVFDIRNERMAKIPGTHTLSNPQANAGWLLDNSLAIVSGGDVQSGVSPSIQLFQLTPTRDELIKAGATFPASLAELTGTALSQDVLQPPVLAWPSQLNKRELFFGITFPHSPLSLPSLLVVLNLRNGALRIIGEIPYDTQQVSWAPDLSGVLVLGERGAITFLPANGGELQNLRQNIGSQSYNPTWLSVSR